MAHRTEALAAPSASQFRSPGARRRSTVGAYALVIAAIVAMTLLRLLLDSVLQGRAPYALYYLPILLAAWFGGVGPTLMAVLLSAASAWVFVVPREDTGYSASMIIFLLVSGAMVVLARAARARQEECEFLAAIVESSDDAIVTKDLNGVIRSWNPGAERLFHYVADEIVGRPVTTLIPPENEDEETRILERLRNGERIDHYETVRLAKGGRRLDVSLTISPVRGRYGELVGASKIARDISERKRAAEAIAAEREWLDRTLQSIGDAVIATDAHGKVVFLNPVAERLTGWASSDACGQGSDEVFRIVNENTRQTVESPITRVLRLGVVVGLANSTVLIAADGTERPIDDSGAPIVGSDGKLRGVVLVFRDISDRRRLEAERSVAVVERERLLESERAARGEAEQANRSKDEFIAMVSHELRTPLNAIKGWAELVKGDPADVDTVRHGIEVIERNSWSQEQLISDLLDMSRIISGKLRLDVRDIDLIAIINAAIETTRPAADARGISVDCSFDPSVASTTGDPSRLQQCVWNLLSNAIKFTPQGGRVAVHLRRSNSHVEICVTDNGIGIRPQFLPLVFERFRQIEPGTSKRSGGLGLGLAIVRQLIELHGGHARVESLGEGQGATFTLALPIRAVRTAAATHLESDVKVVLDHINVLLVEDDPDNREVLRKILEQHHASVSATASAREALEFLQKARPHILISDIGLPDIDGYELIRSIRRLDSREGGRIPAIALTAHASSQDRMKALRAGFQSHIAKPVDPRELVASIASLAGLVVP
ncbi:PAS domain S-box protein [Pendulispora rubella]|uniref:histidine kinase n=1 Tax=Pendulispora rubella TaxID=2741070 RepID=A0ABZ2L758_9BACT